MPSDNLNIPFVTTSQNQKELTINDAINALDNAQNTSLVIAITTDRTLTTDEFTDNFIFNLIGSPVAAFEFVIPATERLFAIRNNTGQTATVKYAASGSLAIADGDEIIIHSDGTSIVSLGGGAGGGGDGTDAQARAGATRFVVPGTYTDPSDTDSIVNRDALHVNGASSDARALNAAITGLSGVDQWSGYIEFNFTTLPATGSVAPLYAENFSAGDSLIWLEVRPDGSIAINSDKFFTEVATAAGVIVTGTTYRVAPVFDFSAPGQPIKLFINGVNEITDVAGADLAAFAADVSYRAGAFGPATADGVYSRAAIFSGLLSDAEAIALTEAGDPQGFTAVSAVLRAYWKLDEGTGTTAVATVGSVDMTLTGAGAGWSTIPISVPIESGVIVRVIDTGATGAFATHEDALALKTDAGWTFLTPVYGWNVFDQTDMDEDQWSGSAWVLLAGGTFTGGTLTSALNEAPITTLASAGSLDIGAEIANTISISGTTTITALGTIAAGAVRRLAFQGILTLTHNGTSLILPTGASIVTAAGDVAEFVSLGAGNWRCFNYMRASGRALSVATINFEIGTFLGGLQLANTLVFKHVFAQASTFADDFAGSILQADVAATASKVYDIRKNGVSVGSATVAISGTSATFVTGAGATSYSVGDRLEITTPAVQDTTLADVSISLLGTRN